MPVIVAAALLCLAVANVGLRHSFAGEVEDGVLWIGEGGDVVARDVADGGPGGRAGVQPGDRLLAIDGAFVSGAGDVVDKLHAVQTGDRLRYTVLRADAQQLV
nr:PDZ domain-containing protein [Acidobacteriota bacterium]